MKRKTFRITSSSSEVFIEEDNTTGVFVPVTEDNLKMLQNIVNDIFNSSGTGIMFKDFISENVLAYRPGRDIDSVYAVWHIKAQKKYLMHTEPKDCGIVYYPPMVAKYYNGNLDIYAVKEKSKSKLTRDSLLYKMPFPNMYASNSLCFGSVKQDKGVVNMEELMEDMEQSLFASKYSHGLSTAPMKGDPEKVFRDMFSGKIKTFPLKYLMHADMQIKDIL